MLVQDGPAAVAATFTTNRLPAAPVQMNKAHLAATAPEGHGRYGWVEAMMSTSGCANAATGEAGLADQRSLAATLATHVGTRPERVLAMSTGLIGTRLPVERVADALAAITGSFRTDDEAFADVAEAMRTTDSRAKSAAVRIELPGPDGASVTVTVSGVAKGVGMIHPNMATMLSFVLTDADARARDAQRAAATHRGPHLEPDQRRWRSIHQRHRAAGGLGRFRRRSGRGRPAGAGGARAGRGGRGSLAGAPAGRRRRGRGHAHHLCRQWRPRR